MESRRHWRLSGLNVVIMGAFISLSSGHSVAYGDDKRDTSACYFAPGVALNINIKYHSLLVSPSQAAKSGQPVQTVYSVHGKFVDRLDGPENVFMTDGTIIVGSPLKNYNTPSGAHLGVTIQAVTGNPIQEVALDCTTDQVTPTPDSWSCAIRQSDGSTSTGGLLKADPVANRNCSLFK